MNGFAEYIGRGSARPSKADLATILKQYPWFTTARILLAEEYAQHDNLLTLHRLSHPKCEMVERVDPIETHPAPEQEVCDDENAGCKIAEQENDCEIGAIDSEIIDSFLSKGDYRIVPNENITEYDAAEESAVLDITDDFISEELAEIYLAQGLNAQAKDIYARLSLLNPEKSVYFAEILGKIDSDEK